MANVYNIISASTLFRKQDFAILRSIGMSTKQIDKMFCYEGIFYGFSGIVIGVVVSMAFMYIIGKILLEKDLYAVQIPIMQTICVVIVVCAVIFFAMLSARKKIKDINIIDDVKNDMN